MEITKREIIASIVIISVMLIIGFIISGKITDSQNDKNAEYQKAVQIDDTEIFQYGMRTNSGNAFVYGELKAVDTVTYPEISGKYMYVKKVKEKYTRHTKRVKSGKHYTTRTYYTWDYAGKEDIKCKKITFRDIEFKSVKIQFPEEEYIKTIKESRRIRYKYYGVSTKHTGTIYTRLADNTISDKSKFFKDCTIEQALEKSTSGYGVIIFWVCWIIFIALIVAVFYYFDNRWLEDN